MQSVRSPLDAWLARLEKLSPAEINLGLDRVQLLLDRLDLGLPETVLHVGGTNGKGSSVGMLEALLRVGGARVGSYTSPHMLRYNERIRVDAQEASDARIVAAFERIEAVRDDVPLTYFEYGTLAALVIFAAANVDCALLEVGMGGRLDAVNAVEPTAGLITNVSLDHCAWLGEDIETIAAEKAGIMRPGRPIVYASRQRPAAIDAHAASSGAKLIAAAREYDWSASGDAWTWRGTNRELGPLARPSLVGAFQLENAAGVLALIEAAGFGELLHEDTVNAAFGQVKLGGRMQSVSARGNWLLDVAHNPSAAAALADALRETAFAGNTIAIIGMLDDKDVEGIVVALGDCADHWIAATAAGPRAIPAVELARRVANVLNRGCLVAESLEQAVAHARALATDTDRILVTGSFYLVGPTLEHLL